MATDLDVIVQGLNELLKPTIPLSLVSFDELRGREISKVLNDVCAALQPDMKVNIASEDPAVVGQKHFDFLSVVLAYKSPPSIEAQLLPGLIQGDPKIVRPVLLWILQNLPAVEKRVYLAKYLMPIDIPEDVRATTEGIAEVWETNEHLMKNFREVHRAVEKFRKMGADPGALMQEIADIENDKVQLKEQVQRVKAKYEATGMSKQPKFLQIARAIRDYEEKQSESSKTLSDQRALLNTATKQVAVMKMRLTQASKDSGPNVPIARVVAQVQEEVSIHENLLNERLPADIAKKREQVSALDAVLNQKIDLETEKSAVISLTADIKNIEAKHRPKLSEKEEQSLAVYRQQAALVAKRRAAAQEELDRLEGEHLAVDKQREERDKDLNQFRGSRILVGEDFKRYATGLREKREHYMEMKSELQELRGEYGVLLRTVELLKSRDEKLEEIVTKLEEKAGVRGARDVARQAEEAAARRMVAEELKGKTLDELAKIVEKFEEEIVERRKHLTPQIMELRKLRLAAQGVEQEYLAQKEQYEGAKASYSHDFTKTREDLSKAVNDSIVAETGWHCLNVQLMLLRVQETRVTNEKEYAKGKGSYSDIYPNFKDVLSKEIQKLEMAIHALQAKKSDIDKNHLKHAQQVLWFRSLKRILDMKLTLLRKDEQRAHAAGSANAAENYLRLDHLEDEIAASSG